MATLRGSAWTGWIVFAGIVMLVVSSLNIFEGFLALITDERVVATPDRFIVVDTTSWGWTLIFSGAVMMVIAFALLAGATWGRIAAIVVIGLHAILQVLWLGAYPVWSLLMITLDVVVLFALCARWSDVRSGLRAAQDGEGMATESYGRLPHETPSFRRQDG